MAKLKKVKAVAKKKTLKKLTEYEQGYAQGWYSACSELNKQIKSARKEMGV